MLEGPHADPEFLTPQGLDDLYGAEWTVHHNSARTGVRLVGPTPGWARADGGDAGLHPSNIHDTAYATGAVDLTGDMPILLGPDGPSLGGFVCPAVITAGDRWKLGQLRPGDRVRLVPVDGGRGRRAEGRRRAPAGCRRDQSSTGTAPVAYLIVGRQTAIGPTVTWRQSGEDYLLVEYGPMTLDLALRFRVQELQRRIEASPPGGVIDVTPGIRSLQVHVDPDRLPLRALLDELQAAEAELPAAEKSEVPTRIVHLPLSWDDPSTREAIERYTSTVNPDAPWCPWNIEFIRRINGLADVDEVHRIVFDASYLVLGLGDVYLGAPVATPLDPRHRLVTTKYNPARTWTPENAVGIGGAYLCVYGMEGPGGYQFVGRTVPVWNRFRRTAAFTEPWLLRFFDQLQFFEVERAGPARLAPRPADREGRVDDRVVDAAPRRSSPGGRATTRRASPPSASASRPRSARNGPGGPKRMRRRHRLQPAPPATRKSPFPKGRCWWRRPCSPVCGRCWSRWANRSPKARRSWSSKA